MSGSCSARLMVSRASQVGPKTEQSCVGPSRKLFRWYWQWSKITPLIVPLLREPIEGENDAELHPAAVHLFVGFRHSAQRIFLNHWVHGAQQAECQRILRIPRCAGIPTSHP